MEVSRSGKVITITIEKDDPVEVERLVNSTVDHLLAEVTYLRAVQRVARGED